jgi:5-hydroxyisourate hydrolase-like protein (transthyretin family)
MRYSASLLLLALPILCQDAAERKKCSIQGQVLNGLTGEPIRKVEVTLMPSGAMPKTSLAGVTDASGRFSFEQVEPGKYYLTAQKTGFLQGRYGARSQMSSGTPLSVAAGQSLKDLAFKLMPQGSISGRVLDDEGEPIQNAMVQVLAERSFRGKRQFLPSGGMSTNDRGEYRVSNLGPGKYLLMASPSMRHGSAPPRPDTGKPEMGLASVYYPGVLEQSQAARIELALGAELTGHDLRLRQTRVARIRGKAINGQTGEPAKGIMVTLARELPFFDRFGVPVQGEDGQFELASVTPGSYTLSANMMRPGEDRLAAVQPVEVGDRDIEGIVLTLKPGENVSGTILVDGDPKKIPLGSLQVYLSVQALIIMGGTPSAAVQPDGSFTLKNVTPGKFEIAIGGPSSAFFIKSIKVGDMELTGREVDWTAGLPAGAIAITLSTKGAAVAGSVEKDGKPASGAVVALVPDDEARRTGLSYYRQAVSDQTGAFAIKNVPPGAYKAYAFDEVDYASLTDPEVLKPIESKGVPVKLDDGGSQSLELKVIPASAQ